MSRIVTQDTVGGPDVLHAVDRDTPTPAAGQVLIRSAALGVNVVDAKVRAGLAPMLGDPPFTVGWDVAGTVETLGAGVDGFAVGDRVAGLVNFPQAANAYAEHVIAPAEQLVAVPAGVEDVTAGALPLAGLTALQVLREDIGLQAGQRLLIQGAGGGVGHLAVQIAKQLGAQVIATAGPDKVEWVRSLGADQVIDYTTQDFATELKDAPVDAVFVVNGDVDGSPAVVKAGGIVASIVGEPSDEAKAAHPDVRSSGHFVHPDPAGLTQLFDWIAAGALTVTVGRTFPLDDAAGAHRVIDEGHTQGKIVLIP